MVEILFNLLFTIYSNLFLYWWPWISISSDIFLLQSAVLYILLLILNSKNIYYILLYVFIEIFVFGIYLSLLQLELFTGFLWVIECTVVFIFLIVLFYTNFKGYINDFDSKIFMFNKYAYVMVFFFLNTMYFYDSEGYVWEELNIFLFWEDFYEALANNSTNDFSALALSYYTTNSLEFLFIGVILLVGSVVCVNLYKTNKNKRVESYGNFLTFFNFFKDSVGYIFTRKQDLQNQSSTIPSSKMFKKKI
jgi:hypothetical protein